MSTSKHIDKICIAVVALMLVLTVLFINGEQFGITVIHREEDENTSEMFTANDLNADWDTTGACEIVLNGDSATVNGNGAYFSNGTLYIAYAGKYVIRGTLDGSIHIDADGDDKIWLLFDGVDIQSKTEPRLYIKQADNVFLTLKENSQNTLAFENDDEEAEIDGCIFSRDDLTVNGKGSLTVTSSGLHGIVCNDSLVFTGGNININAKADGVHAHDAIKICNTTITVSAGDDGLHAGNDDETAVFYLESGNINIAECYEGIEANDITVAGGTVNITPTDDGINANGSGKTSLITVSGGDTTVINKNGRDADGFDSNGSINITGGNVFISVSGAGTNNAIDYGSESGGKFTISGGTVIACGSSQMAENPAGDSAQGFIMGTVSGNENETISVLGADGKEIISKEIPCSFTSALISSPNIAVGDTLTLKVGDTVTEVTANNTESVDTGGFGNQSGFDSGGRNGQGDFPGWGGQNPFENEDGNTPPELPNGSGEDGPFPRRSNKDNNPPQKPDGNFPGGDMSGGQNGTPPEMPNGDNGERPQMPDGEQGEGKNEPFDSSANDKSIPNGQRGEIRTENNEKTDLQHKKQTDDLDVTTWVLTAVSIVALAGGFVVVIKKK